MVVPPVHIIPTLPDLLDSGDGVRNPCSHKSLVDGSIVQEWWWWWWGSSLGPGSVEESDTGRWQDCKNESEVMCWWRKFRGDGVDLADSEKGPVYLLAWVDIFAFRSVRHQHDHSGAIPDPIALPEPTVNRWFPRPCEQRRLEAKYALQGHEDQECFPDPWD